VTGAGVIPIVREEDFASPALTNTIQQLLSQVQSRLVGVFREDDMPISACCICHAAHQFWLQLCTHALKRHAHMSLSSLSSHAPAVSSAGVLALPTECNTSCCVAATQACSNVWQNMQFHIGAVWGYVCIKLQSCNTFCNTSLQGSVAEMLHSVCFWHPYPDNSSCPDCTCSRGCQSSGNHNAHTAYVYLCTVYDQHAWPKQIMSGIRTTAASKEQQCHLCPPTGTRIVLHLQLSSSVTFVAWLVHCKGLSTSGVNDSDAVLQYRGMLREGPPEVLLRCCLGFTQEGHCITHRQCSHVP